MLTALHLLVVTLVEIHGIRKRVVTLACETNLIDRALKESTRDCHLTRGHTKHLRYIETGDCHNLGRYAIIFGVPLRSPHRNSTLSPFLRTAELTVMNHTSCSDPSA